MIISGYDIFVTPIYESNLSLVYRGIKISNNLPVICKISKLSSLNPSDLIKYEHEYKITQSLKTKYTITAYDFKRYQNRPLIIFEDFGGMSLDIILKKDSLGLKEFLNIAIKIAEGLEQIHSYNVIHKDINPSNIVYNRATKELKIIDFGISTVLSKGKSTWQNSNRLEGTLPYISPEQTGRINCCLDYRTDFYSLGVTFYQLLTQKLPFQTKDPRELIHSHIAKSPISLRQINLQIPPVLENIITKLMSKTPEARYQSAFGLKVDLEKCQYQLFTTKQNVLFQLAQQDLCDRFQISEKLYGRERQINQILKSFERVQNQGDSELLLVSGYSGIGKTSLIRQIQKPITETKGHFISGKFDQYQQGIPYSAIVQAFENLIESLLVETETNLTKWRKKILNKLNNNGQVVINLLPKLEIIIGEQPQLPLLPPQASESRFKVTLQNFIQVFARSKSPLVIFLDDLQWADNSSLQLIQEVMIDPNINNLLLIGAYRNNEISLTPPFKLAIDNIEKDGTTIEHIQLSPLRLSDINNLIGDTLKCSVQRGDSLAELVLAKTNGNPFFVKQFLTELYRDKFLYFDPFNCCWKWDLSQIELSKDITNNVIELLINIINKLSMKAQKIFKIAACIGNHFNLELLTIIVKSYSQEEVTVLLREGVDLGLLLIVNKSCHDINNYQKKVNLNVEYKIVHDRVKLAFYSLMSEKERQETHYKIGQAMLNNISLKQKQKKLFAIVSQLNLGYKVIDSKQEKVELAELNLAAAKKAKLSSAFKDALKYLDLGLKLLTLEDWQLNYELTLELYIEKAETAYLIGDFESVDGLKQQILAKIPSKNILDRVKISSIEIETKKAQGEFDEAIKIAILLLNELGETSPTTKLLTNSFVAFLKTKIALFKYKSTKDLIGLPIMKNPKKVASMNLLEQINAAVYFKCPQLLTWINFKKINLSIKYGNHPATPTSYVGYGINLLRIEKDFNTAYYFGQLALELAEKLNVQQYKPIMSLLVGGFLIHIKRHLNESLSLLAEGFNSALKVGNLEFANYNAISYLEHCFLLGVSLNKIYEKNINHINILARFKYKIGRYQLDILLQSVCTLTAREIDLQENQIKLDDPSSLCLIENLGNNKSILLHYYFYKLIVCYLKSDYMSAQKNAILVIEYINIDLGVAIQPVFYFYDSLVKAELFFTKVLNKKGVIKQINKNQKKLKEWADNAPMNYSHKYYLVEAEKCKILGQKYKAIELYDLAITKAKENKYIQEEALANELAAKFYLQWGKKQIAKSYMKEACYKYYLWGANVKVKYLEEKYLKLLSESKIKQSQFDDFITVSGKESNPTQLAAIDLATVLKSNQILSSNLNLEKLLIELTKNVMQVGGAQKACLILPKERENRNLVIEVIATLKSKEEISLKSMGIDLADKEQQSRNVPILIINYVVRTRETVILNNAIEENKYAGDPYIIANQIRSVFCIPLVNQSKLIGLVYLENNLIPGAFRADRIEVLKAIASQAAISIQNARLFKERIETEQALSKKEKQLSDFLEAMPVGVFIANSAQKTYYLNQTARKILGRGVESVSFEDLAKFYNAYDTNQNIVYPEDKSPVGRALKGEKSYTSDMEIRRPDFKAPIPLDVWSTPIKNEKGEVEYAIAAFQDISDRKKAKEELETKNAELETTKQQLKEVNRTLEEKVKERTKELQEAVGILKQTQKKLIDENYSLKDSNKSKYFYLGGKVPPESPSYVIRNADVILVRALKEGEYCYIFNGRTMGKSSLLARTQKEFESKGFKCAEIDMSKISYKDITANQWYLGLIDELLASFDLIDKFDCFEWWMKWEILSPPQRFNKFITQILLKLVPEQIIIFFDEIDSLICLKFNTDDFFVLLRSFYNARGNSFGFERLNIVLLGAANPLSLIKDYTRTPFNIGQIIRLEPFEFYQMNPLIEGLKNICVCPESIIKEILYWTGGQPFLTQKLCSIVYKSSEKIERGDEKQVIAKLVRDEIIEDWTTKDRPQHLTTISDRLLFTNSSSELLKLCQLLLETGEIPFSENDPLHEELVLTGLVYVKSNKIKLYNRIYENIFDRNWIADNSSIS